MYEDKGHYNEHSWHPWWHDKGDPDDLEAHHRPKRANPRRNKSDPGSTSTPRMYIPRTTGPGTPTGNTGRPTTPTKTPQSSSGGTASRSEALAKEAEERRRKAARAAKRRGERG